MREELDTRPKARPRLRGVVGMIDFTRTIPGAGCLDLRLTVESGQPRVELVDRVTHTRHVWRPVDHGSLVDLAQDVSAMEQHVRYGGGA